MSIDLASLLVIGVSLAVPLLLAAFGELIVERAGVLNVGIEGMALAGALAGYTASCASHNPLAGAAASVAAGVALASLSALLCIRLGADQVVVGTAINILSVGITGVLYRGIFGGPGHLASSFQSVNVPVLFHLPLIGPAFFRESALGYLAWLLAPCCAFFLSRTKAGLRLISAGEVPEAANEAGVRVTALRVAALLWGGALAGLSGAYLSIDYTNGFTENMTAGRGFIALAVVILGRWNANGIMVAALLFGLADALHYELLSSSVGTGFVHALPYQALQALPYVMTLMALLLRSRLRTKPPAALGRHFRTAQ